MRFKMPSVVCESGSHFVPGGGGGGVVLKRILYDQWGGVETQMSAENTRKSINRYLSKTQTLLSLVTDDGFEWHESYK